MAADHPDDRPSKRPKGEKVRVDANEVLVFHLATVDDQGHLVDAPGSKPFAPLMCHQVFGDDEMIEGLEDVAVDVWLNPVTLKAFVSVQYTKLFEGATDVLAALYEWFTEDQLVTDKAAFIQDLQQQNTQTLPSLMKDTTKLLDALAIPGGTLDVYSATLATAPAEFKKLHQRLQPLLVFFVDGARYIDEDPEARWDVAIAIKTTSDGASVPVGYCSTYTFHILPGGGTSTQHSSGTQHRLRLSQMLVLPPYQRSGIGSRLIQAVYKLADMRDAYDVTFEEPVPELQLLREKLDLKRLLSTCPVARDAASAAAAQEDAPPVPPAVLTAARQQLRLNKRHMRCMWEVLLGTHTDVRSSSKGRPRLMELITSRMVGPDGALRTQATTKRIVSNTKSWVMCKAPHGEGEAVVAVVDDSEEAAHHDKEEITRAVNARMSQFYDLSRGCGEGWGWR